MENDPQISLTIKFEEVSLPPFKDILILAKNCPHGKFGISKCLNFLAPENFDLIEVENTTVEAILVSKKILKKMPAEKIIQILKEKIFPYLTKGDIIKVDFGVRLTYENIEVEMD